MRLLDQYIVQIHECMDLQEPERVTNILYVEKRRFSTWPYPYGIDTGGGNCLKVGKSG